MMEMSPPDAADWFFSEKWQVHREYYPTHTHTTWVYLRVRGQCMPWDGELRELCFDLEQKIWNNHRLESLLLDIIITLSYTIKKEKCQNIFFLWQIRGSVFKKTLTHLDLESISIPI